MLEARNVILALMLAEAESQVRPGAYLWLPRRTKQLAFDQSSELCSCGYRCVELPWVLPELMSLQNEKIQDVPMAESSLHSSSPPDAERQHT